MTEILAFKSSERFSLYNYCTVLYNFWYELAVTDN